jgi:uncharacterized membrane protein
LFWGIQHLFWFDFHELSFAVPIISWALFAFDKRKWRIAALLVISLLLVKENLGLTVAAFGIYFIFVKERAIGIGLIAAGLTWLGTMIGIVMPWLAGHSSYNHWSYASLGATPLKAAAHLLTHPWQLITHLFNNPTKTNTLYATFASFTWLPVLSPLWLLALPSIFERMLSDNQAYWAIGFQYSATLAPILAFATLDTLRRLKLNDKAALAITSLVLLNTVAFTVATQQPLTNLFHRSFYDMTDAKVGDEMIRQIPANASVAAQDQIVPHLSHRTKIYQLGITKYDADYIAINPGLAAHTRPAAKNSRL